MHSIWLQPQASLEGKWEDERSVNLWLESKYLSPVGADLNEAEYVCILSFGTEVGSGSDALATNKERRRKACRTDGRNKVLPTENLMASWMCYFILLESILE